jgi:hypothetical protein
LGTFTAIFTAGVAVLAFDTFGSLASRRFHFAYSRLMVGSFAIYVAVGFLTATEKSIGLSVFAGGMVGLIESTLGWAISWKIGPGRPAADHLATSRILSTVVLVTATAGVFGGFGGWLRWMLLGRAV